MRRYLKGAFAKKVQAALDALGWSQTRLAKEAGVNQQAISRWLTSGGVPGFIIDLATHNQGKYPEDPVFFQLMQKRGPATTTQGK